MKLRGRKWNVEGAKGRKDGKRKERWKGSEKGEEKRK